MARGDGRFFLPFRSVCMYPRSSPLLSWARLGLDGTTIRIALDCLIFFPPFQIIGGHKSKGFNEHCVLLLSLSC